MPQPDRWRWDPQGEPLADEHLRAARREAQRRLRERAARQARARRRRRLLEVVLVLAIVASVAAVLLARGTTTAPGGYAGAWQQQGGGQRMELRHLTGQKYEMVYGVSERTFPARLVGDEVHVNTLFGAPAVLTMHGADRLTMREGATTTVFTRVADD